jgi:hypothetical protein
MVTIKLFVITVDGRFSTLAPYLHYSKTADSHSAGQKFSSTDASVD